MKCCPECFGDRGLRKSIFPALSPTRGTCDFCHSQDVDLVDPIQLIDYVSLVVGIYEPDPQGKLLVDWFKEDWHLFQNPNLEELAPRSLLAEILNDGEIVRRPFSPSAAFVSDKLNRWEKLRNELMYENRYFPETQIDLARLDSLLSHLPADDLPTTWFRARVRTGSQSFTIGQMGAPPKEETLHGRANPSGIPYLYLGSTAQTAASEVRPHTGEVVCVADFSLPGDIKAVDLRNPRQLVSPFLLEDEDEIGLMRLDIAFLERLGDELTRPVLPRGAAIEYIPSQYLCEFIKKSGYDGVVYRSSVSDGINLALFDPSQATPGSVKEVEIVSVSVEVRDA